MSVLDDAVVFDLLVAIVERAQADAAGSLADLPRGAIRARVQQEAEQWLQSELPGLIDLATDFREISRY